MSAKGVKYLTILILALLLLTSCTQQPSQPTEPWSFTEVVEQDEYTIHYHTYFSNGLIIDRWTDSEEGDTR